MPLEDSPSLDTVSQGFKKPEMLPQGKFEMTPGRKRLYAIGLIILLVLLVLVLANDSQQRQLAATRGQGAVRGQVIDQNQQPVQAEVLVFGLSEVVQTDAQGQFSLDGLPTGQHTLVVGYQGGASEFPMTINNGEVTDIGQLRVSSTAIP